MYKIEETTFRIEKIYEKKRNKIKIFLKYETKLFA